MGLGSTLIILGLIASAVYAQNQENLIVNDGAIIRENDGETYLANGATQIIKRPDGKFVVLLKNSQIITDPSNGYNNILVNTPNLNGEDNYYYQNESKTYMFVTVQENSYVNSNGHAVKIVNGGLQLSEGGQEYTFLPRPADVNQIEKVDINGQQATVEFSGGNVILELADGTLIAKLDNRVFTGDREGFNNREQLVLAAKQQGEEAAAYAHQLQIKILDDLIETMGNQNRDLQQLLGNLRF